MGGADSLSVRFRQARRAIAGVGIATSTTLGGLPSFAEAEALMSLVTELHTAEDLPRNVSELLWAHSRG